MDRRKYGPASRSTVWPLIWATGLAPVFRATVKNPVKEKPLDEVSAVDPYPTEIRAAMPSFVMRSAPLALCS